MATINNNTNIMSIRVTNLPDANTESFYTGDNKVNSWFENNSYLLLCQAYSDDNETGNPLYYKSEKVKVVDISNLVYEKYKDLMTSVFDGTFTGNFNGIFHHQGGNINYNDPSTYDTMIGSSSGYFTGIGDIIGGTILNSSINSSVIDANSVLNNTKAVDVRGTFYGADESGIIDNTNVRFYGKATSAETATNAGTADYAVNAGYADVAKSLSEPLARVSSAETADNASNATYAVTAGTAEVAVKATEADHATVADSAAIADVAKYAQNVGQDSYPVGYCQYIKLNPGSGQIDVCDDNVQYDTINNKWVKFMCYSSGYYTLTFDFTALRLSKDGSKGEAVPYSSGINAKGQNLTSNVYYGDEVNKSNKKGQSIISKLYNLENQSVGSELPESTANSLGTVIQFQNINGAASDQFCPETIQCRNVIYNVYLEKDKEYILMNDFYPFRPDFLTDQTDRYFPNEPAGGLFYKISSTTYGSNNNIIMSYTNYDNTGAKSFVSYLGPVLEIRKVAEKLTTTSIDS